MSAFLHRLVEIIEQVNGVLHDFAWGPVMLVLLVGTGVYLTFRTRFIQLRRFGTVVKGTVGSLFKKRNKEAPRRIDWVKWD